MQRDDKRPEQTPNEKDQRHDRKLMKLPRILG